MQLTIRSRLVMLSSALLLVLAGTTGYLTHELADEAAATARAAAAPMAEARRRGSAVHRAEHRCRRADAGRKRRTMETVADTKKKVRVVVADDHPLYREGVVRALAASDSKKCSIRSPSNLPISDFAHFTFQTK